MHLELTTSAWLAYAAAVGLWAASVLLTKDPAGPYPWTWRDIPLSFFGLAWITFGLTFILRYLAVAYDPQLFRATQFPLWMMPGQTFSLVWIVLMLYWGSFVSGYLVMTRLAPYRPGLLGTLDLLAEPENLFILDLLVICCACLVVLSGQGFLPRAISTPLSILGGFYVIAAAALWFGYFRGRPVGLRRFFYLLPGILVYFFSPYRTLIFSVILCILLPVLKNQRWRSLTTFLLAMLALLIVTTVVNDYRRTKQEAEVSYRRDTTLSEELWGSREHRKEASWVRLVNRFHGFDSMALTIHFVPSFSPHSQLNIFTDLVWRVVPRSIMDKKADTHRGREFSTTIWAMGERGLIKRPEANISPTMSADLYQINGIPLVMIGAALYGLLVGLLENWQRRGTPLVSCILVALFGVQVALGIEQEFNFASATLIQTTIGLFFLLFFLPLTAGLPKPVPKIPANKERA